MIHTVAPMIPAASAAEVWVPCPRCRADEGTPVVCSGDRLLALGGEFWVVRCKRCEFLYTNPQPGDAVLARHYPPAYPLFAPPAQADSGAVRGLRRRLRAGVLASRGYGRCGPVWLLAGRLAGRLLPQRFLWLPPFVAGGTLVEAGCATGAYLAEMRDLGWNVIGVEPDSGAAATARDRFGLDVRAATLEQANLPASCADVVAMRMVLEHVRDPRRTLAEARRILRPGGLLLVSVPNAGSLEARLFGRHWFAWDLPRHLSHFTAESLGGLLGEAGLGGIRVRHLVNANNLAGSLRYRRGEAGPGQPGRALQLLALVAAAARTAGRIAAEARAPAAASLSAWAERAGR